MSLRKGDTKVSEVLYLTEVERARRELNVLHRKIAILCLIWTI
jgi:hypothetical protein